MHVVIAGGGIAGLALAAFLTRTGHDVEVVEKASAWDRAGYGISLWGDGIRVLEALDLGERFQEIGTPIERWKLRDADGRPLAHIALEYGPEARPLTAVHRGDLHGILRERTADVPVRMGTTVTDIEAEPGGVRVRLSDGATLSADLLVGADGVHSGVRDLRFERAEAKGTGTAVWSFWVPEDVDVPAGFTEQWGEGGTALLIAPIADRHMASLAAPVSAGELGDPVETLRERARGGDALLGKVVAGLPTDPEIFHDRLLEVEAPTWVDGRVVLIGDAAHAVHPIVGMGATLALEDAQALARTLANEPEARSGHDLERFERERKTRAERVRREAAVTRAITFTRSDLVASLRDALVRHTPLMETFMRLQVKDEAVQIRRLG